MFSPRVARRTLTRYREKGLGSLERRMLETIASEGLDNARVLEVGGGIGAIQAELLAAGADRGEIIELASAYEPFAGELARELGVEERSSFRIEDVLENPGAVEPADLVVLNRVVCCSPDGVRLVATASRLCRRTLAVSFPRSRLLVRGGLGLVNGAMRIMGRSFRVFVHPRSALLAAAEAEGLELTETGDTLAWEFVVLRRRA
jgi:magnesium-protoporphyrin O-methyltransferase